MAATATGDFPVPSGGATTARCTRGTATPVHIGRIIGDRVATTTGTILDENDVPIRPIAATTIAPSNGANTGTEDVLPCARVATMIGTTTVAPTSPVGVTARPNVGSNATVAMIHARSNAVTAAKTAVRMSRSAANDLIASDVNGNARRVTVEETDKASTHL